MKHTNGPWGYVARLSGSENHKGFRVYGGPNKYFFAEVMPMDSDGKEGEATARLIAAAPDLLAALEEMVKEFEIYPTTYYADVLIDSAKQAIAKAKGETP